MKEEYFNYETYPDTKVWEACLMSCSIPIIFQPYKYNGDLFFDGGINGCTTKYFKNQKKTLGIILESFDNYKKIDNFQDYFLQLVSFPLKIIKKNIYNSDNTITIDTSELKLNSISFNLNEQDKISLYDFGFNYLNENDDLKNRIFNFLNSIENKTKNEKNKISIGTQTD